ncbi:MAG: hypothetical protein ABR576_00350 [Thermoanaerobaculia bacterium]
MTLRARDVAAAAGLAAVLGCRAPGQAPVPVPPTPTGAVPTPTATATVSPLPVEASPAPSIYDRTPGVMHEEPGTRPRQGTRTPTPRPRPPRPAAGRS